MPSLGQTTPRGSSGEPTPIPFDSLYPCRLSRRWSARLSVFLRWSIVLSPLTDIGRSLPVTAVVAHLIVPVVASFLFLQQLVVTYAEHEAFIENPRSKCENRPIDITPVTG